MYFPGVGNILDQGRVENGPGIDFFRYPKVEKGVDDYIGGVRKPVKDQFHSYVDGTTPPGVDAPTTLHEAERRISTILDRNGPPLAIALLMQEYEASSVESPVDTAEMPAMSEFRRR